MDNSVRNRWRTKSKNRVAVNVKYHLQKPTEYESCWCSVGLSGGLFFEHANQPSACTRRGGTFLDQVGDCYLHTKDYI